MIIYVYMVTDLKVLVKRIKEFWSTTIYIYIWVYYNDLTATSLEIMVSKGNHPQMALIQISELL